MKSTLVIGKIKGIAIQVHLSWLVIFGLITYSMAISYIPTYYPTWSPGLRWLEGAIIALLLFVSVLLHELSHSVVSKSTGLDVKTITLFIFGGVAQIEGEPDQPLQELRIAVAGPGMSIFLGIILLLLANIGGRLGAPETVLFPISYMGQVNLILAAFNLVPAFPLDGGRVLRALIWHFKGNQKMATQVASSMGNLFAYFLIFMGVFSMLTGNLINGVWLAFIGWFIHQMSQTSYQQTVMTDLFKQLPVREFMTERVVTVNYLQSIEDLVENYVYKYKFAVFPVLREGEVMGIVGADLVRNVPREAWGQTTVGSIALLLTDSLVATPEENVTEAMTKLFANGIGRVLVMDRVKLVGIVSRTDIVNYMSIRAKLDK